MLYVYNLLFCYSYFMVFGFGEPVINLAGFFCFKNKCKNIFYVEKSFISLVKIRNYGKR